MKREGARELAAEGKFPVVNVRCRKGIASQILGLLPKSAVAIHYRTHAGAEVDLVIEQADGEVLALEIKRTLSPKVTPSLIESMATLGATRGVILIPQGEPYPLSRGVTACGLVRFLETQ